MKRRVKKKTSVEKRSLELLVQEILEGEKSIRPHFNEAILAAIKTRLLRLVADPEPNAAEIKTYYTLLLQGEKLELLRLKQSPSSSLLSDEERRERIWNLLGYSEEEKTRLRQELKSLNPPPTPESQVKN